MSRIDQRYPSYIVGYSRRRVGDIAEIDFGWRERRQGGGWDTENGLVHYAGGLNELQGPPGSTVIYVTAGWEMNRHLRGIEEYAARRNYFLVNAVTFAEGADHYEYREAERHLDDIRTIFADKQLRMAPTRKF